ncbi:15451_t:CDS:1, partial [Racocetra persica]
TIEVDDDSKDVDFAILVNNIVEINDCDPPDIDTNSKFAKGAIKD